jgi:hypothetical protein
VDYHTKEECPFRFLDCVWGCGMKLVAAEFDDHKLKLCVRG